MCWTSGGHLTYLANSDIPENLLSLGEVKRYLGWVRNQLGPSRRGFQPLENSEKSWKNTKNILECCEGVGGDIKCPWVLAGSLKSIQNQLPPPPNSG
jgi:hypothetical protein